MSDEEWERWRAAFQKGGRVMPDVVRRARNDGLRARWAMVATYAVTATAFLLQLWALAHKDRPLDRATAALACVVIGVVVGAGATAMQGTWSARGDAPLDALAALDRRNAGRQRVVVVMRWCVGLFCAAAIGLHFALGSGEPLSKLAQLALPIVLMVLVDRRARWRFERDRREIAEARRLLAESAAADESAHSA